MPLRETPCEPRHLTITERCDVPLFHVVRRLWAPWVRRTATWSLLILAIGRVFLHHQQWYWCLRTVVRALAQTLTRRSGRMMIATGWVRMVDNSVPVGRRWGAGRSGVNSRPHFTERGENAAHTRAICTSLQRWPSSTATNTNCAMTTTTSLATM